MSYNKKTWTNRTSEYPNRYRMTSVNGNIADVAIIPKEGNITNEGDRFDAATMNDMETRIDNEFSSVESSMSAQDTTLRGLITAEQTRATGIENLLRNDVDTNTSGLASEISRATAKENQIAGNLANEITRATDIEGGLRTDVTSLQGRMTDTESDVDTLTSRIATLEQSVEIETDRAEDAEATLDTKIDGVASDLDAEVTRATGAESTLTTNLANEVSRAQSVENTLTTSITNEIARATQAESNLHDYVDQKVSTTYKASGSIYFADLPALTESRQGNVYNIKDAFITTADFVEGEGKSYKAGTNVAIVGVEEDGTIVYKYDVQTGFVDYSIFAEKTNVNDLWKVQGEFGAKNLLVYPYYEDSRTVNGVAYTVNNDGSITADGTASLYSAINLASQSKKLYLPQGNYILSCYGAFSDNQNKQYFAIWYKESSSIPGVTLAKCSTTKSYEVFTITQEIVDSIVNGEAYLLIRLVMEQGTTIENTTFYPMLRYASDTDGTWQPYTKTNRQLSRQLTEEVDKSVNWDEMNVLGAKNLLFPKWASTSMNGVTFSVNTDMSITVDGTATKDTFYSLGIHDFGTLRFATDGTSDNSKYVINGLPINSEFYLTYNPSNNYVNIVVKSGYTVDNVTVYPMVRLKSIKDDTYVPYAKSNRELTQQQYTFVGVCDSAGSEQNKVVTVDSGFKLEKGVRIAVKFSNTNTYSATSSAPVTLNVNNSGAKNIYYSTTSALTGTSIVAFGTANRYTFYVYDGTYWVWDSFGYESSYGVMTKEQIIAGTNTDGRVVRADYLNQAITEMIEEHGGSGSGGSNTWIGTCNSAANEQNKVATVDNGFELVKGVRIGVKFSYTNTFSETSDARITLNVNNTGAKSIYYAGGATQGTNSKAFGLADNYIYYIYNGTQWVFDGMNREFDTTYSAMSVNELKTGTATSTRTVRADYLNTAINEMIDTKVGSLITASY